MKNVTRKKTPGAIPPPEELDIQARIRIRAYELWLANGQPSGTEVSDWLQAERACDLGQQAPS